MRALREHPVTQNLFRTIVYLCFGSGLTLMLIAMILVALRQNETNNFAVLFLVMGVSAGVGGTLWARSILKDRLIGSVWRAARSLTSGALRSSTA